MLRAASRGRASLHMPAEVEFDIEHERTATDVMEAAGATTCPLDVGLVPEEFRRAPRQFSRRYRREVGPGGVTLDGRGCLGGSSRGEVCPARLARVGGIRFMSWLVATPTVTADEPRIVLERE
jgi:hypothetical protein